MTKYIPDRFDIVNMDIDPQAGSEIKKRRPCLVLSTRNFNRHSGKVFVCRITSSPSKALSQIPLENQKITGTILVDQMRSLDWQVRKATKIEKLKNKRVHDRIVEIVIAILTENA